MWSCLCIYICLVFLSVDVHFLPLSPLPSLHSKYLHFFGENCTFLCHLSKFLLPIFSCLLKFLTSPFLLNIKFFLTIFSRLFINLYIVIKFPLSLLSPSMLRCISFNPYSYVRSFNSGTILVAILCIFLISAHAFSCEGTILLLHISVLV